MENFVFEYPTKVYFGKGEAKEHLGKELECYGKTVMLAYGGGSVKKNGIYEEITEILREHGKTVVEFTGIMPNPTYAKVLEGAKIAREKDVDLILAVGGGSVIDCCKVVALQAVVNEDVWESEIGKRKIPAGNPIPLGAIVTVSGTGAEMNGGAVITNEEKRIKTGIYARAPRFSILDPEYTMSVPFPQVLSGAFDTLSHAMETYFGYPNEDNVSDDINEAVMRSVITNMRVLLKDPQNYEARSNLMWDSAMAENGLLKLGKKTDFQVHQIEHQLGAYTDCNHGQGLAVIHPVYYRHIFKDGLPKFIKFAKNVWGLKKGKKSNCDWALSGIDALAAFIDECGLPTRLTQLKTKTPISDRMLEEVAYSTNLMPGSYKKLTHGEIYDILMECK